MLLAVGVTAARCRASPSGTRMPRRQGRQKGRVFLRDLKTLLLGPPPTAMNGQQAAGSGQGSRPAEEGGSPDGEQQDCPQDKLDKLGERLSLSSCTDSGARTPLCRICFQGPEQVRRKGGTSDEVSVTYSV